MKRIKVWPHLTLIVVACALLGAGVVALWSKYEQKAEAAVLPSSARVERVEGEVGLSRNIGTGDVEPQWIEVTPNTPVSVGDSIYARDDSRTAIAFTGRNFARLDPNSSLDVLSLSEKRTQLALREGSAIFNIGALESDGLFEVATPRGAIDLQPPGLYEVGLNEDNSVWVSVLSGLAQVVGLAGSGQVSKGEMLTLVGQTSADIILSRLSPDYAGSLLDDYYGYQYPDLYDGRYSDYNTYLSDPNYYDPSERFVSYRYVDDSIPGVWELDQYGDWQDVSGYGQSWRPRVAADWAPYQEGQWIMDNQYGLTWVSNEPWGYAPYHYGRWVNAGGQWYWVPETANTQPVYSPALVAFVPLIEANEIGWVPLAPGDPYVTTYYDANWQPHYVTGRQVIKEQVINLNVPGAVTIVSVDDFGRTINPKALKKFNSQKFAGIRPILDPLSVSDLRRAALRTGRDRRRIGLPPGLAKRLENVSVITSAEPIAPPFKKSLTRAIRFEVVPEKQKKQKLQFSDERQAAQVATENNAAGPGRKQHVEKLSGEASRGNKEARRQIQAPQQQDRTNRRDARNQVLTEKRARHTAKSENASADGPAEQRAQGERVGFNPKAQKQERQKARAEGEGRKPHGSGGKGKGRH